MVAKELDVPLSDVTGMKPLDFVERNDIAGGSEDGSFVKNDCLNCW